MAPCVKCSSSRMQCSRTIPCTQCGKEECCIPSATEISLRANDTLKNVWDGKYFHNDHANYKLYQQIYRLQKRLPIKKVEFADICGRVKALTYSPYRAIFNHMDHLPVNLKQFISTSSCYKVEWMFDGLYACQTSVRYGENFMSDSDIIKFSKNQSLPPKTVDYCRMSKDGVAYKLWVESITNEGKVVSFTGSGYWANSSSVKTTQMEMMTCLLSYHSMISVTTMSASDKFLLS